ncbi:hypothetical protein [Nocardia sp. NPDC052566]|uniref:hypothetical protein n=1 Tax=Nocardia sp. NPDC052566 TaxID=3364330 RepID=UPI0037CB4550
MGSISRVLSCVFATAAPLFVLAPNAAAAPDSPYTCSGVFLSSDGAAEVESCVYAENGVPRAFGGLTIKSDTITRESCTMSVTVVDYNAYETGANENVATSGPFPCFNGRYPSPPLTVDRPFAIPGHRYRSYTEVTNNGQGIARIYSPDLIL